MNLQTDIAPRSSDASLVVWRIVDGKAGHESQTAGLVQALSVVREVECYDIQALGRCRALWQWGLGKFRLGKDLPSPDLILAAGHRTHFSVLAARRACGGRSVVLMKPSLPLGFFDCCLIPEHDRLRELPHVERTYGVLNTVLPAKNASLNKGLFLIGGPSTHHGWDTEKTIGQVLDLVRADSDVDWVLTTSRRTPDETETALVAMDEPNLSVVPFVDTQRGWVAARLRECGVAWVSEDSVSMVFEALSSGANVGILDVPKKKQESRVQRSILGLIEAGYVVGWEQRLALRGGLMRERPEFSEAKRCAELILDRFGL